MTDNEVAQEIGRRIRHWRTSSPPPKTRRKRQNETGWRPHLTIEELAKATGLTVTTVNKLELGYKSPRIESLLLLAQAFGCEPSDLLPRGKHRNSGKADLLAVYIVDVTLTQPEREAALLAKFASNPHIQPTPDMAWHPVGEAPADLPLRPVVVGFGPCGMFAALVLAQMGFRPIVLERGTTVRQRTKDTWGLWRKKTLNAESNVQFGEGGAGTFSDGKLYSQIKDPRFLGRKVMQEFVKAGAPAEILYEAHPHIGTFKLVKVVESMREQIIALGGEVRFEQRVVDVLLKTEQGNQYIRGLSVKNLKTGLVEELPAEQVVVALGHSARDTFAMLFERGVDMQAKPFSVGFRIEHPQSVIDRATEIDAPLWRFGHDFNFSGDRQQWAWAGRGRRFAGLAYPALRGANQLVNASGVLAALEALREKLPVAAQAVRNGLAMVELPGRFQIVPGQPTLVLDVAHNPQAAGVLNENLASMGYFPETWAVVGMLADKDVAGAVRLLRDRVDHWLVATLPGPRGLSIPDAFQARRIKHLR